MVSQASADPGEMRAAQELSQAGDPPGAMNRAAGKSFAFLFYRAASRLQRPKRAREVCRVWFGASRSRDRGAPTRALLTFWRGHLQPAPWPQPAPQSPRNLLFWRVNQPGEAAGQAMPRHSPAVPGQPTLLAGPGREERVEKVQGGIIKTLGLTPQQEAN